MRKVSISIAMATCMACFGADLYSNGPLVTHPGAGVGGADVSAIQTSLGSGMAGYGIQLSGANRVADDFTVPAGGWHIDSATFFLFQTNSGITPTISDIRVQIWDGKPDEPGSQVIFGSLAANRLSSVSFANVFRSPESNLAATNRPVMKCVANLGVTLAPGTYWLDWSADGTATLGPHCPPVTRGGQAGTGNALLFSGNTLTWSIAYDTAVWNDDMPFILSQNSGGFPQAIFPALYTLSPGGALSGGLLELYTSNDLRFAMRPGVVFSNAQRPIALVLEGYAPSPSGSALQVVVESQASGASINQRVEVYNFATSSYEIIDGRNLTTADQSLSFTVPNPADHIGSSNAMRIRISYASTAAVFAYPWQARVDEATWRFTP